MEFNVTSMNTTSLQLRWSKPIYEFGAYIVRMFHKNEMNLISVDKTEKDFVISNLVAGGTYKVMMFTQTEQNRQNSFEVVKKFEPCPCGKGICKKSSKGNNYQSGKRISSIILHPLSFTLSEPLAPILSLPFNALGCIIGRWALFLTLIATAFILPKYHADIM